MSEAPQKFEQWAILEVMGHQRFAGYITEETIAGAGFFRVDVPPVEGVRGFTKYFPPGSLYAITPCTEEVAKETAARIKVRPVQLAGYDPQSRLEFDPHEDPEGFDEYA